MRFFHWKWRLFKQERKSRIGKTRGEIPFYGPTMQEQGEPATKVHPER
jgi:hypothetical protein